MICFVQVLDPVMAGDANHRTAAENPTRNPIREGVVVSWSDPTWWGDDDDQTFWRLEYKFQNDAERVLYNADGGDQPITEDLDEAEMVEVLRAKRLDLHSLRDQLHELEQRVWRAQQRFIQNLPLSEEDARHGRNPVIDHGAAVRASNT